MFVIRPGQDVGVTSIRLRLLLLMACVFATRVHSEPSLNETRSTLEKWVQTRQLISKTRTDWQSDKEIMEGTAELFERELKALEEKFSKLGTNSVQVEKDRMQAETLLKASEASLGQTRQFAAEFEGKLRALAPQLPVPLQEIIKPHVNKLPADSGKTEMPAAARLQTIVAVLNELDKFNNAVNIFSEKRKNGKGEEVAVETLYVGLGAGYFVNDAGDFAGMGRPGANGWEWSVKNDLAHSVRETIRIYRNERGARFVALPAVIH